MQSRITEYDKQASTINTTGSNSKTSQNTTIQLYGNQLSNTVSTNVLPPISGKKIYSIPQTISMHDSKYTGEAKVNLPIDFTPPQPPSSTPVVVVAEKKQYTRVITFIVTDGDPEGPQETIMYCPWDSKLIQITYVSEELSDEDTIFNMERCSEENFEYGTYDWLPFVEENLVINNSDLSIAVSLNTPINKGDYVRVNLYQNKIIKPLTVELILTEEI